VGDVIVAVNGRKTIYLKHADVVGLLQSSTVNPAIIEVEYSLPDPRTSLICLSTVKAATHTGELVG